MQRTFHRNHYVKEIFDQSLKSTSLDIADQSDRYTREDDPVKTTSVDYDADMSDRDKNGGSSLGRNGGRGVEFVTDETADGNRCVNAYMHAYETASYLTYMLERKVAVVKRFRGR